MSNVNMQPSGMSPEALNRALREWAGWTSLVFEHGKLYGFPPGHCYSKWARCLLTDRAAIMGLLEGLTKEQKSTFSRYLLQALGIPIRFEFQICVDDAFSIATTTTPPLLAEVLARTVGVYKEGGR